MDLAGNFFVVCTDMKVYLYNYSFWVELGMNIHKGKGYSRGTKVGKMLTHAILVAVLKSLYNNFVLIFD